MRRLMIALAFSTVVAMRPPAEAPYYPPAGQWAHKNPADVGMDAAKLNDAIEFMKAHETTTPAQARPRPSACGYDDPWDVRWLRDSRRKSGRATS